MFKLIMSILLFQTLFDLTVATTDDMCSGQPMLFCQDHLSEANLTLLGEFPSLEALRILCLPLNNYLNCLQNFEENCGWIDSMPFSSTKELFDVKNLTSEICQNKSVLHKDYESNVECLTQQNNYISDCEGYAMQAILRYGNTRQLRIRERDDPYTDVNLLCLRKFCKFGCMIVHVQKNCSESAYMTVMEILRRSHVLERFCSQDDMEVLENRYTDFCVV